MAFDAFDQIGTALALAEYAVARAIGKKVAYKSAGSPATFVYCTPARMDDRSAPETGTRVQEYNRTFWIAAQKDSAGNQWPAPIGGIRISDTIKLEDHIYRVLEWTDLGTNSGSANYSSVPRGVYRIETVQVVAKHAGDVD